MKRFVPILLSLMLLLSFSACKKADTEKWQSNDTFSEVEVYKYGDTVSAQFASEANIKIKDNNYDHFVKYIEDLKNAGFRYLKNGDIPENYNLNNGTASWRCSNGKLYLQLIFSEDGTDSYNMFDCNVQIYGYSKKPDSWASAEAETKAGNASEAETTTASDSQNTDKAETTAAESK